ncbi:MAG TPA: hypothetical protein VMH02_05740, partial [Verrucomicrobiae bacterium]|nr:hypothetical protein [Verrucomicrobiae bacterium]
ETFGRYTAGMSSLTDPRARVRPISEPVPAALVGTPAGAVFAEMARMNDGERHTRLRAGVEARIAGLDEARLADAAQTAAGLLARELDAQPIAAARDGFAERFPLYALLAALGVPRERIPALFPGARAFARGISANASELEAAAAAPAARALLDAFEEALPGRGFSERANDVGFMFQSYEAMSVLLARAIAASADSPEQVERLAAAEPPIPRTRRFFADEPVPVELAATPFGEGSHACPGKRVALVLCALGVRCAREATRAPS